MCCFLFGCLGQARLGERSNALAVLVAGEAQHRPGTWPALRFWHFGHHGRLLRLCCRLSGEVEWLLFNDNGGLDNECDWPFRYNKVAI